MASCSLNETNYSLSTDNQMGTYQKSDFEISSTNQEIENVDSLELVVLMENSTAKKITTILRRYSIFLMNDEKISTRWKKDLKKITKKLIHTLIELPICSDKQKLTDQCEKNPSEFSFKITMKERNQLIDQLVTNKDYVSSEIVSNEMKKALVSNNNKLIASLFNLSLRPVDGNEIYDFNLKQSESDSNSSSNSSTSDQETNESNANLFHYDETKDTPPKHKDIWRALLKKDLKAIDYFIRIKQVNPNLKGLKRPHQSFLHHAVFCGDLEIVKYLVSRGADINPNDGYSNLLLHKACFLGKLELVKFLISKLNTASSSKGYQTCLNYALYSNDLNLVKFLIENGDKNCLHMKDHNQKTPLDYAVVLNRKQEIVDYLKSQMN